MKNYFRFSRAGAVRVMTLLGVIFGSQIFSAWGAFRAPEGGLIETELVRTFPMADIGIATIDSNVLTMGLVHSNLLVVENIRSNRLPPSGFDSNLAALERVTTLAFGTGMMHSNFLAVGLVHSNLLVLGRIHSNGLAVANVHSNILGLVNATARALALGNIHSNHLGIGIVHSNVLVLDGIRGRIQPDLTRGDDFTVVGGLWVFLPVEALLAPQLSITQDRADSTVTVAWPSLSPGFTLQQKAQLSTTGWFDVPQAINDDGTYRFVTLHASTSNMFRLVRR